MDSTGRRVGTARRSATEAGALACTVLTMLLDLSCSLLRPELPQTPIQESRYQRLTSSAEVADFLATLGRHDGRARHIVIGKSAGGRTLDALLVSATIEDLTRAAPPADRLRVMILGSQHGTEASGAEAILILARDLLGGSEEALLADMEFVLVPLGNPDGREARRRVNANGVNLSTDFTVLSQPESRALVDALWRWQPDVFLDLHESAVFKRQSLARQGYMTAVEAQVEIANNPNVDPEISSLSRERTRPAILARLRDGGLAAQEYIGEITDIHQPITHGGLTLKNLRNRAGLDGVFSLLVENRLDPSGHTYGTPRNIRIRTAKQLSSLDAVLSVCRTGREHIMARSRAARSAWRETVESEKMNLSAGYVLDPDRPEITIPLQRIDDGSMAERAFEYHGRVVATVALVLPAAYAVRTHQEVIGQLLDRQHIRYETLTAPRDCRASVQRVRGRDPISRRAGRGSWNTETTVREESVYLPAGTLWVPLRQPGRRLIPLLLDPLSNSSVFEHPDYASLVVPGEDFFVLRVHDDCGQLRAPRSGASSRQGK